ncbi:MAG: ATP-binding protein [Bacteroidota bacterium]
MRFVDIVNRDIANLENCEQEPIHIPGSIQPHGFLLALDRNTLIVKFCSGNIAEYTGTGYEQILGKKCAEVLHAGICEKISQFVKSGETALRFRSKNEDTEYEFALHYSGGYLIVEAETHQLPEEQVDVDLFRLSKQFLGYMEDTHTLKDLCAMVAAGIRRITGYDRVMVYRFDKDYNGEVFAEEKRDDLESFYGLHYPHTDIPAQARELYIRNLLRIIVDINYTPVPIYTIDEEGQTNLDLSLSILRSVSPIHVQYLHNIGVGATMTISLMHKGKLWGLVACHHYSPKHIHPDVQMAARLQGHFITSQIDVRQLNEEHIISHKATQAAEAIFAMKHELKRTSLKSMVELPLILDICNATGVSLVLGNVVHSYGATPSTDNIYLINNELSGLATSGFYQTNFLSKELPALENEPVASGVMYYSLGDSGNSIMWYRKETVSTVNWAGDPAKAIEKNKNGLSPRKSFELWKQTLKLQSEPWKQAEMNSAQNFVNFLEKHINSILLSEEEAKQRELARILKETNAELENINWISTHDLQEPLRKIQITASHILSKEGAAPEDVNQRVDKMRQSAERMQKLLKDILRYVNLNSSQEAFTTVDLNELLEDLKIEVQESLAEKSAVLEIGTLPEVYGIPFLIKQVFANLTYNSLKFAHADRQSEITITSRGIQDITRDDHNGRYLVLEFTDNGIGFDPIYNESIFRIFTRLEKDHAGSGIGLALCRKIMQLHKGYIVAEGMPGSGVRFEIGFLVKE